MFLVAHELCLFGDMLTSIIFVAIEMSIFCGVDFFTTRPAESGLEDTEGLERELRFYFTVFWRLTEIKPHAVSLSGGFW